MAHSDESDNINKSETGDENTAGNLVGEGVGGLSGIAAGMALGSLGGPIGLVIGGLAGAVGGWWGGRAISEAAAGYTDEDDSHYSAHYNTTATHVTPGRSYDQARPAYQLGHLAGQNPDYANRSFEDVEPDLQRGWTSDISAQHGDWSSVRGYARDAYDRGRSGTTGSAMGSSASASSGSHVGSSLGSAAAGGAAGVAGRVADTADDMKDRVDGNPASRPGRDATDSPRR